MVTINTETFVATGEANRSGGVPGTVEMKLRTGVVIAEATYYAKNGEYYVKGFVGRYQTSVKPWNASVQFKADGTMGFVNFGRDDRSGRFNKRNAISYEPETYNGI